MERYLNLGGDSAVRSFEIGEDCITVQFVSGTFTTYVYTYASAGAHNVERMKVLARAGRGLNSFISTVVKKGYASRR